MNAQDDLGYDLFRPRDEFDEGVHPESMRGKALALIDATEAARGAIAGAIAEMPWYTRLPVSAYLRIRGFRRLLTR